MLYTGHVDAGTWSKARVLLIGSGSAGLLPSFQQIGLYAELAATAAQARRTLQGSRTTHAVMCDPLLPDGNWRHLLRTATDSHDCPAFILVTQFEDSALWVELVAGGGFDLVTPSISVDVLRRTLSHAIQRTLQRQETARAGGPRGTTVSSAA